VLVAEGRELTSLGPRLDQAKLRAERVPPVELERFAPAGVARGVVALADSPLLPDVETVFEPAARGPARRRVAVALDGVEDPQNLGAVVRAADFFGALGVFWARDRSAPLSAVAVRASAGATERLPLCQVTNLSRALEAGRKAGFWVVGTVVDGGRPLREAAPDLPDALVLVLGGEDRGLRRLTREHCDFLVTIEGGGVGSLNVASAAAVALALLAGPA
jgi:23S rRNA (guanosine2251-2'-O)-methyltransferase